MDWHGRGTSQWLGFRSSTPRGNCCQRKTGISSFPTTKVLKNIEIVYLRLFVQLFLQSLLSFCSFCLLVEPNDILSGTKQAFSSRLSGWIWLKIKWMKVGESGIVLPGTSQAGLLLSLGLPGSSSCCLSASSAQSHLLMASWFTESRFRTFDEWSVWK